MFCPNCGAQIPDNASFCPVCGATITAQGATDAAQTYQQQPSYQDAPAYGQAQQVPTYGQAQQAPTYGQAQQQAYQQTPAYGQAQQQAYQQAPTSQKAAPLTFTMPTLKELFAGPNQGGLQYAEATGIKMKWFKALTYVLLYFGALSNLLGAIRYITGNVHGSSVSSVYSAYPALKAIDVIYGVICLVLVFGSLYARSRLAAFRNDGPRVYLLLIGIVAVTGVVYALVSAAIVGSSSAMQSAAISLVSSGVVIGLNVIYFRKRQHLFTM